MAIRWGHLETNPCREVQRIKESPRKRYVTDEELEAVQSVAPKVVALLLEFDLLTGQRIRDVLKIRLDDIQESGLHIEQSKTKQRLIISLSPDLQAVIEQIRRHNAELAKQGATLFHTRSGTPYTYNGIRAMFSRAVQQALKLGLIKEPFRFQDIRAKSATDAERAGQNPRRLLGHKHQSTTDIYIRNREIEPVEPLKRVK